MSNKVETVTVKDKDVEIKVVGTEHIGELQKWIEEQNVLTADEIQKEFEQFAVEFVNKNIKRPIYLGSLGGGTRTITVKDANSGFYMSLTVGTEDIINKEKVQRYAPQ